MRIGSGQGADFRMDRNERLDGLGAKVTRRLQEGPYGKRVLIGLRRDLAVPFSTPTPKIPISLREFRVEDLAVLFPAADGIAAERERTDIMWRLRSVEDGILRSRCFVAIDETSDRPCHIQWITDGYSDAIRITAALPELSHDEALLENAYTPSAHRGLGLMPAVTGRIAERAAENGVRFAVAFIDRRNFASLRGGQRAGLLPWQIQTQRQYGFGLIRRVSFEPIHGTPNFSYHTQCN